MLTSKYVVIPKNDLTYEQRGVYDFFQETVFDKIESNCWIAGGALRKIFANEHHLDADIDIYFPSNGDHQTAKRNLLDRGAKENRQTENAISLELGGFLYDLVKIEYKSALETIEEFDFTVCCAAVDRENLYYHKAFFKDLENKELYVNNFKNSGIILGRLQKYIKKGYSAPSDALISITHYIANHQEEILNSNAKKFKLSSEKLERESFWDKVKQSAGRYNIVGWDTTNLRSDSGDKVRLGDTIYSGDVAVGIAASEMREDGSLTIQMKGNF